VAGGPPQNSASSQRTELPLGGGRVFTNQDVVCTPATDTSTTSIAENRGRQSSNNSDSTIV
jgi:hypothetical protein